MLKQALIFVHRWLGVVLCLLFLLWFPSGFVMMYWDYPSITAAQRLAHTAPPNPAERRPAARADVVRTIAEGSEGRAARAIRSMDAADPRPESPAGLEVLVAGRPAAVCLGSDRRRPAVHDPRVAHRGVLQDVA